MSAATLPSLNDSSQNIIKNNLGCVLRAVMKKKIHNKKCSYKRGKSYEKDKNDCSNAVSSDHDNECNSVCIE